jgi:tripeptide aminopeptidase
VQEEIGLHGARHVRKSLLGNPSLTFNWDGGAPDKLTVGATGGYRMTITVSGLASHAGGAPEHGVSAIGIAALAIADLQREGWHGDIHQAGRHGTSNIGTIQGGSATNVVADRVVLRAEARSHDATFRQRIIQRIERAFRQACRGVTSATGKRGSVEFDGHLDYEAFRLADDEPCVLAAEQAVCALGFEPMRAITNGGLDANWLSAHGIPTVTLGCGQRNQHTVSEQLDLADYLAACRIAAHLACGG